MKVDLTGFAWATGQGVSLDQLFQRLKAIVGTAVAFQGATRSALSGREGQLPRWPFPDDAGSEEGLRASTSGKGRIQNDSSPTDCRHRYCRFQLLFGP